MNRSAQTLFAFSMLAALAAMLLTPVVPARAQEIEPEEPEIVLPRVLLEIEDLSVETITAGLPEDELLPEELEVPLPEPEDLVIDEPSIMLSPPRAESTVLTREEGKYVNFEGVIGVGSRNNFMSGFSLYQFEREPEGR
jgi:hypothetical protein